MRLYDFELSGNCYKIRLMMSILRVPYERMPIDLASQEERKPEFLRLNPRGQVPVLVDEDVVIWDSTAILSYIADKYGEAWGGGDVIKRAQIIQWLAFAQNEILYGLARARACLLFARPYDLGECKTVGAVALRVLEQKLMEQPWLATSTPTIADIACYPYVALAPEGDIDLAPYPSILGWIRRIESLDGYIDLPGQDQATDSRATKV